MSSSPSISSDLKFVANDAQVSDVLQSEDLVNTNAHSTKPCQEMELEPQFKARFMKKFALMFMYSGKGYFGLQINPQTLTIEEVVLKSLVKVGLISKFHMAELFKIKFQRASRTDKGVSAAFQVLSLQMRCDIPDAVSLINAELPPEIRVLGVKRVTKGFDSKIWVKYRTYSYTMPTFALTPLTQLVLDSFRITDAIRSELNSVLGLFVGTHNFHNYTSAGTSSYMYNGTVNAGRQHNEKSAVRYIMEVKAGEPFECNGLEFITLTVKGASFMLHQIRKMIGFTIAILRGYATVKSISKSWGPHKMDIPRAPGLGLVLENIHYDAYNKRYCEDGNHERLDRNDFLTDVEDFKQNFIHKTIVDTEKQEHTMWNWLQTLPNHHFDLIQTNHKPESETLHGEASYLLTKRRKLNDSKADES